MKIIHFKSRKDGKEFDIIAPETSEDIENNDFIEINGKTRFVEEVEKQDMSDKVMHKGELVYGVEEVYDLYYYKGEFYEFYWDTASGCIFSKLKEEP